VLVVEVDDGGALLLLFFDDLGFVCVSLGENQTPAVRPEGDGGQVSDVVHNNAARVGADPIVRSFTIIFGGRKK